jgi:hypothetical protein
MDFLRNLGVIEHTIQVTSFGGTGTTMLYRFLETWESDIPSNHPNWRPWKHLPAPPQDDEVKDGFRAVYVYGNPMNAVLSVFRREYQQWHVRNMRNFPIEDWDDDWELDDVLAQPEDPFRMTRHFRNWTQADRSYPILLLQFDAIWRRLPEIFAFLGLPSRALDDFPERRQRHSDWTDEPEHIRQGLKRLYGELAEDISSSDEFEVI